MRRAGVGLLSLVLLSVLLCASKPAEPPQREAAKAAISGRVVAADDGTPQRDARVTLRGSALDGPLTTTTGDNGAYRFLDVPPGRYVLIVTTSPHRLGHLGTARRLGPPASPVVEVRPGEVREDVDVELAPAAVISGRVVAPDGSALSGARVVALGRLAAGLACHLPLAWATTDDRGEFRLAGLEPGDYCVRATGLPAVRADTTSPAARHDRPEGPLPTYHPSAAGPEDARVVSVGAGQERAATDVQVVTGLVYRITGIVLRADGQPAVRARLSVAELHDGVFATSLTRTADGKGAFELDGLAPGEYVIRAVPADASSPDREEASAATWVGVSTADVDALLVAMTTGVTVAGQVVTEDAAVPPFPPDGLTMTALPAAPGPVPFNARATGRVDDGWRFEIAHVRGPFVLRVLDGTLPAGWRVTAVRYRGVDVSDEPLKFADTSGGDVEVVIGRRGGRLTGTVADRDRRPAAGRTVVLFPAEPGLRSPTSLRFRLSDTDEAGRYAFESLPPGDYLVAAVDGVLGPDAFSGRRALDGLVPRARTVAFHGQEGRTLDLSCSGTAGPVGGPGRLGGPGL